MGKTEGIESRRDFLVLSVLIYFISVSELLGHFWLLLISGTIAIYLIGYVWNPFNEEENTHDSITGLISLFLLMASAIQGKSFLFISSLIITVFMLNFVWSISRKGNKSFKISLNGLLAILFITVVATIYRALV
ncbi:hypothetical protein ACKXGF_04480 [Alkalibacillus sp. S2W]|uniref:hypothetical protein n=1 Tax=Alkalibacillus sp. S2W TaxID=3386553 RepID=UPI00398CCA08